MSIGVSAGGQATRATSQPGKKLAVLPLQTIESALPPIATSDKVQRPIYPPASCGRIDCNSLGAIGSSDDAIGFTNPMGNARKNQFVKGRRPPMSGSGDEKDGIINHLRSLAEKLGKETITCKDVQKEEGLSVHTIIKRFDGFSEAVIAAGLKPARIYKRDRKRMLEELAPLIEALERNPSKAEIKRNLPYNAGHYEKEFGSVEAACREAKALLHLRNSGASEDEQAKSVVLLSKSRSRRRYGPAIDFRGLRYAPVNEHGVVFLFGMLAQELGFIVESVQSGFPDCDAKLRRPDGSFEGVRIEFEFRSSEFLRHKHDPHGCDLIVCWENDWHDCPLQVIALAEIISKLQDKDQSA